MKQIIQSLALATVIGIFAFGCQKEQEQIDPTSTPAEKNQKSSQSYGSQEKTFDLGGPVKIVDKADTSCLFIFDIYTCADTAHCCDSMSVGCNYAITITETPYGYDTSYVLGPLERICQVDVTNQTTGFSCTFGRVQCGFSPTCVDSLGCDTSGIKTTFQLFSDNIIRVF